MSPIPLGILAVSGAEAGTYEHIITVNATSGTSINVSNIPQTFTHLEVFFAPYANTTYSNNLDFKITLNGITSYDNNAWSFSNAPGGTADHVLYGDAVYNSSQYSTTPNQSRMVYRMFIPNYSLADRRRTILTHNAGHNGEGGVTNNFYVTGFRSNAAITSLDIVRANSFGNFVTPTRLSIFGIK